MLLAAYQPLVVFGHSQIVHIRVEVAIAVRAAVLRVGNNQISGPSGERVSQIVQPAGANTKVIGAVLAVWTGPALIVAAALDKFRFR
jgi:hypothetical protein